MNQNYCECSNKDCEECGRNSKEFKNIAIWKKEPQNVIPPDTVLCLNCALRKIQPTDLFEEFVFEGELEVFIERNKLSVLSENNNGVTIHIFDIDVEEGTWVDPDSRTTSLGPPKRSQKTITVDVNNRPSIEIVKPKEEKSEYVTKYFLDYVKRYVKNNKEKFEGL